MIAVVLSALLVFGNNVVAVRISNEREINHVAIGLATGLLIVGLIESFGHISGAHMNPVVTFALCLRRQLPVAKGDRSSFTATRSLTRVIVVNTE